MDERRTGHLRTVGPTAGFRWLWDAVNIGRRGAGAVFGGAGLLLVIGVVLGIVIMFAATAASLAVKASPTASFIAGIVMMVPFLLAMALGIVGYVRLIAAVESGRQASASDALDGFGDFRAGLRAFVALLVVMLVQQAAMAGLVAWLLPEVGRWYVEIFQRAASGAAAPALPAGFWKFYGLSLALGLLGNGVQAIAIAQVALGGRSATGALRDGVVGALRNLPALLVLALSGIVLTLVLAAAVVALVMLLMMIGKLVALWLAAILAIVLYLALLVAMIAVGGASMYYMWRDIAAPAGAAPAAVAA